MSLSQIHGTMPRGWDKGKKAKGKRDGYLGENRASQVVLRQHFGGSRDDPRVVGGKKRRYICILSETQVKR